MQDLTMTDLTLTDQVAEMDIDGPDFDGPSQSQVRQLIRQSQVRQCHRPTRNFDGPSLLHEQSFAIVFRPQQTKTF